MFSKRPFLTLDADFQRLAQLLAPVSTAFEDYVRSRPLVCPLSPHINNITCSVSVSPAYQQPKTGSGLNLMPDVFGTSIFAAFSMKMGHYATVGGIFSITWLALGRLSISSPISSPSAGARTTIAESWSTP